MSRGRKSMQGGSPFTYPRSLALARRFRSGWLLGFVLALLATGCSHDRAFQDPLRGDQPAIPSKTTAPPPPAAVAKGSATPEAKAKEKEQASTSTGVGNATLTMGAIPRPEQEHPADASAAVLQPPVTKNVPGNGASHIVPISATGAETYESLQNQLKNLGVTAQSLQKQSGSDDWSFYCKIPMKDNPTYQKAYRGNARGANGLNAMKAVLDDINLHPP